MYHDPFDVSPFVGPFESRVGLRARIDIVHDHEVTSTYGIDHWLDRRDVVSPALWAQAAQFYEYSSDVAVGSTPSPTNSHGQLETSSESSSATQDSDYVPGSS